MPGPTLVSTPSSTTSGAKTTTKPAPNKKRVVQNRRRARGLNGLEDDEEVERAALSDTESEPISSGTETETEDETEENLAAPHSAAAVNPPGATNGVGLTTSGSNPPAETSSSTTQPERANGAPIWSEMMHDDLLDSNDTSLPVVDFADLASHVETLSVNPPTASARKSNKGKAKLAKPSSTKPNPSQAEGSTEPTEKQKDVKADTPKVPTAREAYIHRLNTDPSFVPVVGRFWSHDDRLLNKDLRGMSTWWRWRGRGNRGGGFTGRGGRGGFGASPSRSANPAGNTSPVEQQWVHDGYEELTKMEDAKNSGRGGRGGVRVQPTRGWFKGPRRGARLQPTNGNASRRSRQELPPAAFSSGDAPTLPSPAQSKETDADNVPERSTTKVAEPHAPTTSLVVNVPGSKSGAVAIGSPASEERRDKLATPTKKPSVANRANPAKKVPKKPESASPKDLPPTAASTLPSPSNKPAVPVASSALPSTSSQKPASRPNDTIKPTPQVKPRADQPTKRPPQKLGPATTTSPTPKSGGEPPALEVEAEASVNGTKDEKKKASEDTTAIQENAHSQPPSAVAPITIPPIVTATAPGPYGTQYSYAALPPGIAMGESGMLYEISTGRPVILNQPTPPPAAAPVPVFTPRPVLHSHMAPRLSGGGSVSYLPPHMHPSMTPDFHTPPPPHMPHPRFAQENFMYPPGTSRDSATGTPTFFAPPRQSGRLEIKAPSNPPAPAVASSSQTNSTHDATRPSAPSSSDKPTSQAQRSPSHPQYPNNMTYPASEQYYNGPGYYPPPDTNGAYPLIEPSSLPTAHPPTDEHTPYGAMYGAYYHPQQYPQGYNPYAELPQDGSYNPYGNPSGPAPAYY